MMMIENTVKTNNSIVDKNKRNDSINDFIQGANVNYDYNSSSNLHFKAKRNQSFFGY